MASIPENLRELVTQRANGRCEYCQTQQRIVVHMVVDHIIPESAGGATTEGNLCLCCNSCNSYKHTFQTGIDPETNAAIPLYNPRTQNWQDHFMWSGDGTRIIGKTSAGRATIVRLKMNRDIMVEARREWVSAGWHPPEIDSEVIQTFR